MTVERMVELLEIEKECVLRNATGECNRYCAGCDLLQDDSELHEMYTEAIALLKAQEPKPVKRWNTKEASPYCPNIDACGRLLEEGWAYCPYCGQAVKWDG